MKITLSVIKADVGSLVGHHTVHPSQMQFAAKKLEEAKKNDLIIDHHVTHAGDDIELIMTHTKGVDNKEIHGIAPLHNSDTWYPTSGNWILLFHFYTNAAMNVL